MASFAFEFDFGAGNGAGVGHFAALGFDGEGDGVAGDLAVGDLSFAARAGHRAGEFVAILFKGESGFLVAVAARDHGGPLPSDVGSEGNEGEGEEARKKEQKAASHSGYGISQRGQGSNGPLAVYRRDMVIVHVHVHVKPECVDAFRQATIENARQSAEEPGIARFDVIQETGSATRFVLVEVYRTQEATAAHKETAHYAKWRDAVAEMMAEPRRSVKYAPVVTRDA